ncbi:MAG TPA: TonB-dependent receptor [Alphaproteobacteria bacterium]|jgi:iron complex outermembrane receptor protein|nr:TonB-dependent receptor [Alphaproteobacteria bacterium]
MLRHHLRGGTALLALVFAASAYAEESSPGSTSQPSGVVSLPSVVVTATPLNSLTVPSVDSQKETLDKTAGSVGFVDSESFANHYSANLRDVLQNSPGVFVQTRYGQELRLSIRGSGIARAFHTRGLEILQDGIPTNLADGSGDYYQIDPLALRSAEIYKGGNGLAYGSSTLGGAINFVTPTALTAVAPNILRLYGGSFGTIQGNGQMSRAFEKLDFMANATVTHARGFRDHETGDYGQFNGNLGYRLSPTLETRFYVGAFVVDQLLPGTLSLDDALNNPKNASAGALAGDQARNTRVERFANRTSVALDVGKLDLDSWLIHKKLIHPIFQVLDQDGITYGFAPRYTAPLDIGGYRNELIVGARLFGGNNTALQFVNNAGREGQQTLNARQDAYNYEAYAENRFYFLPQLALMTGAKALHDERRYNDKGGLPADPNPKTAERGYNGFNPKLGLLWEPRKDVQAFVDVTRSQDVPDFTDLNQTIGATNTFVPLQSQHAWAAEIGTRGKYERFAWDATYYHSWVRDELLQFTVNPSTPASTFNAGRTVHQGIELGASVDLFRDITAPNAGDTLTIGQLWNWSDFAFRNDPQYGNNRIPGVPQHLLRTTVSYTRAGGFYFSPNLDWVPNGAWVDYANTLKAPGYMLVGLQTGYNFDNGLSLYLDARNLANKRYVTDFGAVTNAQTANTAVFYPGDGRSLFLGMRYAF